jgi:hypothetical protein
MGLDHWLARGDEHVITWRKDNAIHAWFVDHINDGGEINLSPVEVNLEQLGGFRLTCQQVIDDPSKGPDLLPTRAGFFFGGTEYDEYYLDGLRRAVEVIDRLLDEARAGDMRSITYDAWW